MNTENKKYFILLSNFGIVIFSFKIIIKKK